MPFAGILFLFLNYWRTIIYSFFRIIVKNTVQITDIITNESLFINQFLNVVDLCIMRFYATDLLNFYILKSSYSC